MDRLSEDMQESQWWSYLNRFLPSIKGRFTFPPEKQISHYYFNLHFLENYCNLDPFHKFLGDMNGFSVKYPFTI